MSLSVLGCGQFSVGHRSWGPSWQRSQCSFRSVRFIQHPPLPPDPTPCPALLTIPAYTTYGNWISFYKFDIDPAPIVAWCLAQHWAPVTSNTVQLWLAQMSCNWVPAGHVFVRVSVEVLRREQCSQEDKLLSLNSSFTRITSNVQGKRKPTVSQPIWALCLPPGAIKVIQYSICESRQDRVYCI